MRYIQLPGFDVPKHCIYGPRPREGICLDAREWWNINESLLGPRREMEMAEAYATKQMNKKETSLKMTRNWENTLASVTAQSKQKRYEKRDKMEQDKIDKYNQIIEDRKMEYKEILERAQKTMFEMEDSVKSVVVALRHSAVITEREKQIEFKKMLKAQEDKRNSIFAEKVRKDAEDYRGEEEEAKCKKMKAEEFRRALEEQIEENRARREEAEGKERRAEMEDVKRMAEEIEKLKQCEMKEKIEAAKKAKMCNEKGFHALQLEKNLASEEEEETEINGMILKYAKRYAEEKAAKEKSLEQEVIQRRQKIVEFFTEKMNAKLKENEAQMGRSNRKNEEREAAKEKLEEEKKNEARMDLIRSKMESEERARKQAIAKREEVKWTMLQNERRREVNDEWLKSLREKERQKKMEAREAYARQIKEKEEMLAEEAKLDKRFVSDYNQGRNRDRTIRYCDEAIDYAKQRGWNIYPLMVAVERIKKELGAAEANGGEVSQEKAEEKSTSRWRSNAPFCYRLKS